MMNCQGKGVRSSRRSTDATPTPSTGGAAGVDPAMLSVWGDFMAEEGGPAEPAPTSTSKKAATQRSMGPRSYILPIQPCINLSKSKVNNDAPAPGLLAQTGTLDASVPGRSSVSKEGNAHELQAPTLLFPRIFDKSKISFIAASPTSCHSVAITDSGEAYGWGRNEAGQLGLGCTSSVVPVPQLLSVGNENLKFVGAAVGKFHTILVSSNGNAYAAGANTLGQLGVNNMGAKQSDKFRKCVVAGSEDEEESGVKIVSAACGQEVSALLSSTGQLFTAGSAEFGQLGNGETGEYIISAGRLGYANCGKFIRRSFFIQSESDRDGGSKNNMVTDASKTKCVSLEDAGQICLANVAFGKTHAIAIEAPSKDSSQLPRVFTWGCGDYGCLGHGVQADEYTPRLVGSFRGPIFASNYPVSATAGSNCTLVKTKNGHVYYFGKHKQNGEATMRPALVDAMANNGHVVTSIGAGNQTVFCSTKNGVTIGWGHGSHGELGYGKDENKSSSQPKFVNGLDSCLVTAVACGMGHTLFIIRNEDDEDAKALKKVGKVDESDIADFVEQIKSKASEEEPPKKKQKGRPKE